jgi:Xaa-Pro aminopeptidase
VPVIEVHLTNLQSEEFRRHSVVAPVVEGQISGLGPSDIAGLGGDRRACRRRKTMTERIEALRAFSAGQSLDAVVVAKPENRRYFRGFTGSSGLLLVGADAARLITDFRYIEQAARQAPEFAVVRHSSDMYETLAAEIQAIGGGRIGFESDYVAWDACQKMGEFVEKLVPLHLDKLRMVKDEAELASLRVAVRLADAAFDHILSFIRPGVSERDIALELEFFMRKKGAEKAAFDIIVASGPRSALPHGVASDKRIAAGEFVTMDFGRYSKAITLTSPAPWSSAKPRLASGDIRSRARRAAGRP